jgi:hypothetical protein
MAERFPDLSEAYHIILIAKPSSNVYYICRITSSSSAVGSKRLLSKNGDAKQLSLLHCRYRCIVHGPQ